MGVVLGVHLGAFELAFHFGEEIVESVFLFFGGDAGVGEEALLHDDLIGVVVAGVFESDNIGVGKDCRNGGVSGNHLIHQRVQVRFFFREPVPPLREIVYAAFICCPSRRAISIMALDVSLLHCCRPQAMGSMRLSVRAAMYHKVLMSSRTLGPSNRGDTTIKSMSLHLCVFPRAWEPKRTTKETGMPASSTARIYR